MAIIHVYFSQNHVLWKSLKTNKDKCGFSPSSMGQRGKHSSYKQTFAWQNWYWQGWGNVCVPCHFYQKKRKHFMSKTSNTFFLRITDQTVPNYILEIHDVLCPKNLTFPKAERDQRCPRLVVVVFLVYFFQSANQIYHFLAWTNQILRLKWINKKRQQPNVGIADHV